jgi:hypothetical protein
MASSDVGHLGASNPAQQEKDRTIIIRPVFSASGFWPPKAVTDCQTLSFLFSFYKIRWGQKPSKININT